VVIIGYYGMEEMILWDGRDDRGREIVSGIYYYKLKTEGYKSRKKIVIIR
jgi:hypothetical protein